MTTTYKAVAHCVGMDGEECDGTIEGTVDVELDGSRTWNIDYTCPDCGRTDGFSVETQEKVDG